MNGLYSLIIALAMYCRIPMPALEWTRERLGYVMAWFPAVGVLEGGALWLWLWAGQKLEFTPALQYLGAAAVPVLFTGGIHLDGFLDTVDAIHSYGSREKKLEILKDPHSGAFAMIGCALYFLLYGAFALEAGARGRLWLMAPVYILERAFSGLSVTLFPSARKQGLAASFSADARKKATLVCLALWLGAGVLLAAALAGLWIGAAVTAAACAVFFYYHRLCMKEFGGVTGDLAGYFLQICELACLILYGLWPR